MKLAYTLIALGLGLTSASALTLNFSGIEFTDSTFVQDNAGNAVNGLAWGILVADAGGNFISSEAIGNVTGTLQTGAFGSNFLVLADQQTRTQTNFLAADLATMDGSVGSVNFNLSEDTSGRTGRLIWFDGVGSGEEIDGSGTQFAGVSTGTFDLGNNNGATLSITSTDGQNGPANIVFGEVVPEPSTGLLALLGLAGVLRRRR